MKKEEIVDGNKLIAFSNFSSEDIHEWVNNMDNPISDNFCVRVLGYHKNWDMLMEIVDNIRKSKPPEEFYSFGFHIDNDCVWFDIDNIEFKQFKKHMTGNLKESVWYAVIEFIKWFNSIS